VYRTREWRRVHVQVPQGLCLSERFLECLSSIHLLVRVTGAVSGDGIGTTTLANQWGTFEIQSGSTVMILQVAHKVLTIHNVASQLKDHLMVSHSHRRFGCREDRAASGASTILCRFVCQSLRARDRNIICIGCTFRIISQQAQPLALWQCVDFNLGWRSVHGGMNIHEDLL